jgi:hypothetical protein
VRRALRHDVPMPRHARVPRSLSFVPFRASTAISEGGVTRAMLRGPAWRRLLPDVFVSADAPIDHRLWCDAVALVLPSGAAISGTSAAFLWGVNLLPSDAPVVVTMPRDQRMRPHPRITVIRSPLPADDVVRFAGLPVTTPVRTAFDLGRRPPRTDAVVAVDAMLRRRVVKLGALEKYACEHARWPGAPLLREVCALAEPLTESPMETRLRLVIVDGGLPRPVAQHDILDSRGRFLARSDLAYPDAMIAIEYEGDHHRERAAFQRDVARYNALRAAGWLVLRYTASDVLRNPDRLVGQVADAMRERGHGWNTSAVNPVG